MKESAIPAKNLTRPILVEGATRGTYDTLYYTGTDDGNINPCIGVDRQRTTEHCSPFTGTHASEPDGLLGRKIDDDESVGTCDLGVSNGLFLALAV